MGKTTFRGQRKTTSPGHAKTTHEVNRRRPSRSTEDDLRGQPKKTFGPTEDDLWGQLKMTFGAKRKRPSARQRRRRLSSTREPERRPPPIWKTTFHSSHWLTMELNSRLPESDRARVCTPEAAPSSTTLPDRRDLFGVVSGQLLGACHQLIRHRSHCRSTGFVYSENKTVPSQL